MLFKSISLLLTVFSVSVSSADPRCELALTEVALDHRIGVLIGYYRDPIFKNVDLEKDSIGAEGYRSDWVRFVILGQRTDGRSSMRFPFVSRRQFVFPSGRVALDSQAFDFGSTYFRLDNHIDDPWQEHFARVPLKTVIDSLFENNEVLNPEEAREILAKSPQSFVIRLGHVGFFKPRPGVFIESN